MDNTVESIFVMNGRDPIEMAAAFKQLSQKYGISSLMAELDSYALFNIIEARPDWKYRDWAVNCWVNSNATVQGDITVGGGPDVSWDDHPYLNFGKMYEFMTNPPDDFYMPFTATVFGHERDNHHRINFHPGTSRMVLLCGVDKSIKLRILLTPGKNEHLDDFIEALQRHDKVTITDLNRVNDDELATALGAYKNSGCPLQFLVKASTFYGFDYLEMIEDHRSIPGFTEGKNYELTISDSEVIVNGQRLFVKQDNKWDIGCPTVK